MGIAFATAVSGAAGSFSQLTKFKGGFVGRLFGIAAVALVVVLGVFLAAAFWKVQAGLLLAALGTILLIVLPIAVCMFVFAQKNPELAMLEGKEVIQYRQLGMVTKSGTVIDDAPASLTVDSSMPLLDADTAASAEVPDDSSPSVKALPGEAKHG